MIMNLTLMQESIDNMTSPYYNNLNIKNDMIMIREEEHFIRSINDFDDREIEYVISEQDDYVQLAKFNWTKDKGLMNEWRIFDKTAVEVWNDMIKKEIIVYQGDAITLGDEFEKYAEEHSVSYNDFISSFLDSNR